jgi:hypothetical protein
MTENEKLRKENLEIQKRMNDYRGTLCFLSGYFMVSEPLIHRKIEQFLKDENWVKFVNFSEE